MLAEEMTPLKDDGQAGRGAETACGAIAGRAPIAAVEPYSPADDAGFTAGCFITAVDGHPIRDIIDWRWYSADDTMNVAYVDTKGDAGSVTLEREPGEDWGFEFAGAIFDDVMQCENACTFCFVRQLPDDVRDTLMIRDDDFRLSFLQGTFATFTNLSAADEARIIEQRISPLHFSMHAVTPEVRRRIMGKRAPHGVEVAERLLAAGIQLYMQIVLMPGENDGDELRKTLEWAYEHPNILSVGIVPVGYTKHQKTFTRSFDTPQLAGGVIECVRGFQDRAMDERGCAWVHASDEFYRNAYPTTLLEHLPPTEFYGEFELFEDGIGIIRSFVDDWNASPQVIDEAAEALEAADARMLFVAGCAQKEFFGPLLSRSALSGRLVPLYVKNEWFGGNVDVTGLLCGCDIAAAVRQAAADAREQGKPFECALIPEVVFNVDHVTLDDMHLGEIEKAAGLPLHVVSCEASGYMPAIVEIQRSLGAQHGKAYSRGGGPAERR